MASKIKNDKILLKRLENLADGPFWPRAMYLLRKSFPLMLQLAAIHFATVIDLAIIRDLGTHATTALSMSGSFLMLLIIFLLSANFSMRYLITKWLGEETHPSIHALIAFTTIIGVIYSILVALCMPFVYDLYFYVFKVSTETQTAVIEYMDIRVYGIIFIAFNTTLTSYFIAIHRPAISLQTELIGYVVNIATSLILVKHMGISGVALGTVLGTGVSILILFYAYTREDLVGIKNVFNGGFMRPVIKDWFRVLLPFGGTQFLFSMFILTESKIFNYMSPLDFSVAMLVLYALSNILFPINGFGINLGSFINTLYSAKQYDRAQIWFNSGFKLFYMLVTPVILLMVIMPDLLLYLFSTDQLLIDASRPVFRIASVAFFVGSVSVMYNFVLNSTGYTNVTFWVNLLYQWVITIPVMAMMVFWTGASLSSVFILLGTTPVIVIILLRYYYRRIYHV